IRFGKSIHPKWDPQLTATAFWLYLPTRGEMFAEHHLQQAVMSPRCLFQLPRLPTEEELLSATPQLPLPASTPQALSVSELRKHSSCTTIFLFSNSSSLPNRLSARRIL